MPLSAYKLTADQLRALATGRAAAADLDLLVASQRSKCLAMISLVVGLATDARHPEAETAAAGWGLLARVQRLAPAAVESMLRYPTVGAWAGKAAVGLKSRSLAGPPPGWLAVIAAAAAIRGGVACSVELPSSACAGSTLHLPSLGSFLLPGQLRSEPAVLRQAGGTAELVGRCATVAVPGRLDGDAPHWRSLPVLSAGSGRTRLHAVLDDADPYRSVGAGSVDRLTAVQVDSWRQRLSGGWRILARHHRQAATEVRALLRTVTPLSQAAGIAQSLTSRHLFGSIGMSLPESDVAVALTLSHEIQHVKLCALMDLLPLIEDPAPGLYYAPWRPDPRPLASLLQGMYAHLGVAGFWLRHGQAAADPAEVHHAYVEFARWRSACAQVGGVLKMRPELTASGSAFVDGMIRLLHSWRREYVPPAAQAQADQAISDHRRRWA